MKTLPLFGLYRASNDARFWIQRARALQCQSKTLPRWLRPSVARLAIEVRENVNSLRAVGPRCPIPPSIWTWWLTVASLLAVHPRLGVAAARLFLACYALRIDHYRAIGDGLAFTFGGLMAFAVVRGLV